MQIKNFSKYDFIIRDNDLIVRNKETKRLLHPTRDDYHFKRKYVLTDDNGNKTSVQELRIAYCLLNHCDLSDIKKKAVTGTILEPRLKKSIITLPPDLALKKIQELEFCLEKLKHFYITGDFTFFLEYTYSKYTKYQAIKTTHSITSVPINRLEEVYDIGAEMFFKEIKACSFTQIKPLFGMLCKCIKVAYFRKLKENQST